MKKLNLQTQYSHFTILLSFLFLSHLSIQAQQKYETPGTYTWTVPPCVTEITVHTYGGGGGGGSSIAIMRSSNDSEACASGGGGGGGGYSSSTISVTPGQTYTIVVGAGGAGGPSGSGTWNGGISTPAGAGGTGGTSSFSGNSYNLQATGGVGGGGGSAYNSNNTNDVNAPSTGGTGGVGSGGTANHTGGNGSGSSHGNFGIDRAGAGGGAAGPGGNGTNAVLSSSTANTPGGAGQAPGGKGGDGRYWNVPGNGGHNGNAGSAYGGGGSGSVSHRGSYNVTSHSGGAGANGAVIIEYNTDGIAPDAPIISTTDPTCSSVGGASIVGYDASYTYTFSPAGPTVGSGGVISNAVAGTSYTVVATPVGGCDSPASNPFSIDPALDAPNAPSASDQEFCASDQATVGDLVPSGAGVNWYAAASGGSPLATSVTLTATTYYVSQTANGCESTRTPVMVTINPNPTAPSIGTIAQTTCISATGSVVLNDLPAGNWTINQTGTTTNTYTGSGTSFTVTGLSAGTYTFTVTDDVTACSSSASTNVTIDPPADAPMITVGTITPASCGNTDGEINISVSGGTAPYDYIWSDGSTSQNLTGVPAGTYTVTVTDVNNCSSSDQVTVTAVNTIVPQFTNLGSICQGATITLPLVSDDGITGSWSPAFDNTQTTTYTFTPDAGQCAKDTSIQIVVNNSPNTPTVNSVAATCTATGSSTITNYDNNSTYTFTPPGPTVSSSGAINDMIPGTTYTVTADGGGSCSSSSSTPFSNDSILSGASTPTVTVTPASCASAGTSTINNYNTAYTYTFSPAGPTVGAGGVINNMVTGTSYTVTISNGNCSSSPSAPFSNDAQLSGTTAPVVTTQAASCTADGTATVTNYDAVATYTFSPAGPTVGTNGVIIGLTAGQSYTVVADNNNCPSAASDAFTIATQLPAPTITINADKTSICVGDTVILTASGASSYSWDTNLGNGNTKTVMPETTTTYTVTGVGANGCVGTASTTVNVLSNTDLVISADTTSGCSPVSIHFTAQSAGANSFLWDFGDGTTSTEQNPTHSFTGDTCYTVTLIADNGQGCSASTTLSDSICVFPTPNASFVPSTSEITNYNTTIKFTNTSSGATSYDWNFGNGIGNSTEVSPIYTYNPDAIQNYTIMLVAENDYGCKDTATITIKMNEDIIFYVPNAFTPDGDEYNNVFKPVIADGYDYEMLVFDRWGELIFETHNSKIGWDGTYLGKICQDGTYVWRITVMKQNVDDKVIRTGHVVLLR